MRASAPVPTVMAARRAWWRRPQLRLDDQRSVGWLELFFDLVFVVVVSRLAHSLTVEADGRAVVVFVIQFAGLFWVWNAFTYYTERFESGGVEDRLLTYLALLPVAALAVYAEGGLDEHATGFASAYLGARAVNMVGWARAGRHVPSFRPISLRFFVGYLVTAALVLAALLCRRPSSGPVGSGRGGRHRYALDHHPPAVGASPDQR